MMRAMMVLMVVVLIGCGGSKPTPVANPNGPRPMPGGSNPGGSKTEWETPNKAKPGK